MKKDPTGTVRGILLFFMGLTAVFTLLGGVGTVCVAWNAASYRPFAMLAPYASVYQAATIVTLVAGVFGFIATFALVRGEKWSWGFSVLTLLVGLGTALTKMHYSNMLRGSTSPTNIRCYITVLTLVLFLVVRLPGIWKRIDLSRPPSRFGTWSTPTGLTLFVGGLITLLTPIWAGGIHTIDGYNLVNVIRAELMVGGGLAVAAGTVALASAAFGLPVETLAARAKARLRARYATRNAPGYGTSGQEVDRV